MRKDWELENFIEKHNQGAIKHRIDWLESKADNWMREFMKASNELQYLQVRKDVAEQQTKLYAEQANYLKSALKEKNTR